MMPNIVDGADMGGLIRYLLGPGKANEHTEQHLVAGSDVIMDRFGDWSELSPAQAGEIASMVDRYMTCFGVRPEGDIRKFSPETGKTEVVDRGPNHVWHCSLSLRPGEGPLSEEQWAGIAQDFMDEMGFTEASGKAACRWVAVRHGTSKNGGDHIHIAANRVRADGTKWSDFRDQRRSQSAVNMLEHKYGLEVLESREHERGSRCDSADALNKAARQGRPATDRAMLETRLRAAAAASTSEVDFIQRARELGVRLRPRFAAGHTDVVTGYWAALHTKAGEKTQWHGASGIARDLALSRLRQRWPDTPQSSAQAADAWRQAWKGMPPRRAALYSHAEWDARRQALDTMLTRMRAVDPTDPVALADATQDVAGLLAAASHREDITQREQQVFERAARQVGHHAQLKHRPAIPRPADSAVALVAGLMSTASMPSGSGMSQVMTLMALLRLADALADLYRQARQTNTARAIERDTAQAWALVHHNSHTAAQAQQRFGRLAAQPAPLQKATLPHAPQAPDSQSSVAAAAEHILETAPDDAQTVAAAARREAADLNRRRPWLITGTPRLAPKDKKTPTPPAPRKPNTDTDRHAEGRRL
jgi:hypothetical protein